MDDGRLRMARNSLMFTSVRDGFHISPHPLECGQILSLVWPVEYDRSGDVLVSGPKPKETGRFHFLWILTLL